LLQRRQTSDRVGRARRYRLSYKHCRMKARRVTYDAVRRLGLTLPNVEEGTSYGSPALKVKGKTFVCLHRELDKIVLKMPFDRRKELMTGDPEVYFITDHYRDYPWVLVSLSKVHPDALPELLQTAYRAALSAKKRRV